MDPTPDPLLVQLRRALRTALAGVPVRSGVHGAPVTDGPSGPTRAVLDRLGADGFERPVSAGGLDLGLTAGVLVSEELGRAARGNPYRAEAVAAAVSRPANAADTADAAGTEGAGGAAGTALAGLEALPVGTGVTTTPCANGPDGAGGWELTGAVTVDSPGPGPLLVATRTGGRPVLVAVGHGAPGVSVESGCWPPVVRFASTPVSAADVVAELDDSPTGPLAGARLRQAAYLLGIAEGAHQVAVRYTGARQQFGTRLRELPAVGFPLARAMVALRATRAAVYRGAWLVDSGHGRTVGSGHGAADGTGFGGAAGTAPVEALAMAAETARDVVRVCMQSCGVRAMTAELGLHRYFRLAAAESSRYGEPAALWRLAGAARLDLARRAAAPAGRATDRTGKAADRAGQAAGGAGEPTARTVPTADPAGRAAAAAAAEDGGTGVDGGHCAGPEAVPTARAR